MGEGFFDQKTMQSTTSGARLILLKSLGLYGFGTRTYCSRIRLNNHRE